MTRRQTWRLSRRRTCEAIAPRFIALAVLCAVLLAADSAAIVGQDGSQTDTSNQTVTAPPEAPTSLAASVSTAGISLTWSAPTLDVDTISGYRIARRRVLDYETSWVTVVEDTDSTTTAYVDASANVNGAEYEYRVSALRGEGDDPAESAVSNVATVTNPNPARPVDLTASSSSTGIELSWSAGHLSWQSVVIALSGYEIRRIESRHPGNRDPQWEVLVSNTNNTNTSYTDDTGYTTIEYSYAIRAVHGYLRSHWEGIAGPVSGHLTADE